MRMVSPCACARDQSRLNTAAVAAVPFSSDLREVGMTLPPGVTSLCDCFLSYLFREVFREHHGKSTRLGPCWLRLSQQQRRSVARPRGAAARPGPGSARAHICAATGLSTPDTVQRA